MYILYGIPNCDSVKKAKNWFDRHGIRYAFHDYRQEGITKSRLSSWCRQLGWEQLLNKQSTTWKALDEATQLATTTQAAAVNLMAMHPTLIKRPVIELNDKVIVIRFNQDAYAKAFLG